MSSQSELCGRSQNNSDSFRSRRRRRPQNYAVHTADWLHKVVLETPDVFCGGCEQSISGLREAGVHSLRTVQFHTLHIRSKPKP